MGFFGYSIHPEELFNKSFITNKNFLIAVLIQFLFFTILPIINLSNETKKEKENQNKSIIGYSYFLIILSIIWIIILLTVLYNFNYRNYTLRL